MDSSDEEFLHVIVAGRNGVWQQEEDSMYCGSDNVLWKHDPTTKTWYRSNGCDPPPPTPVLQETTPHVTNTPHCEPIYSAHSGRQTRQSHPADLYTPISATKPTPRKVSGAPVSEMIQLIPGSTRYQCLTCYKDFADRYIATAHARRHEFQGLACPVQESGDYPCDALGLFKRPDQLMTHWIAKHGGIPRRLCQPRLLELSTSGQLSVKQRKWLNE
ncbi:hypothetical protein EDC01DRAFT_635294 [Geopyxis carbonaria]|nr:hypothetical protein EDC01DRAFT_635294 [Geopyxis carbonaria]